ncbi:hypothetical protein [Streptomyces sp. NPDC055692]|uniref:hypothetical protein n=1 Tax=Streptomyces sp. NPDC055692 TaxID=3155683 RepID=UPI00343E8DA8
MDIRKIARSLKPGNDQQLARDDYSGQKSASKQAAEARRKRHREAVAKQAANTRKDANRNIRGW